MIEFIITHWNALGAVALIGGILIFCARRGIDLNVGERPVNPYRRD